MRFSFSILSALCLAFAASACARIEPVHNVIEAPVVTGSNVALTARQVRSAIITACVNVDVDERWFVDPKIDGQIIAWGEVHGRMAVIDIFYSPTRYSITYKDSEGLLYDGQQIDPRYNQRIEALAARIELVLNTL